MGTRVLGTDGNIISVLYDPVLHYNTPHRCIAGEGQKKKKTILIIIVSRIYYSNANDGGGMMYTSSGPGVDCRRSIMCNNNYNNDIFI